MSHLLSRFARLDTADKVMFGYVQGMQRALPGVGVEKALAMFAKDMGLDQFNTAVQKVRYQRMLKDFYQDRKTHGQEAQGN